MESDEEQQQCQSGRPPFEVSAPVAVRLKGRPQTLTELDLRGTEVRCRVKGDFSTRPAKERVGGIEDEVFVIGGDTRWAIHRIRKPDGAVLYRPCYHTIESRPRPNAAEPRIGWGQYAPIIPADIMANLNRLAHDRGWEPWL